MAGPPFLDPLPPIGADNAELAAHANAVAANQIFGEGYVQSQLAATGAQPGSMFAHQVAANAAMAAQGAIQQQILPPHRGSGAVSSSSYRPAVQIKPLEAPSSPNRPIATTEYPLPTIRSPRRSPVVSPHPVRHRRSSLGLGGWVGSLVVLCIWYYMATFGFSFLADPLEY